MEVFVNLTYFDVKVGRSSERKREKINGGGSRGRGDKGFSKGLGHISL